MSLVNNTGESWLYFRAGADGDNAFRASQLIDMQKTSSTQLTLTFDVNPYAAGTLTADNNMNDAQAWQTRAKCVIVLAVATGKGGQVMKSIATAINSPISVGDPRARFDRGWITVAKVVSGIPNEFVDSAITDIVSITRDAKATDAIAS
tara:strand:- start:52 stop:498 length:447 start_codon:yes stop_codon:yes gene_type:complete